MPPNGTRGLRVETDCGGDEARPGREKMAHSGVVAAVYAKPRLKDDVSTSIRLGYRMEGRSRKPKRDEQPGSGDDVRAMKGLRSPLTSGDDRKRAKGRCQAKKVPPCEPLQLLGGERRRARPIEKFL